MATATAFTLPPRTTRHHDSFRLSLLTPRRARIDPVVGKAIVEKSGFFAAAIVLAILFEKFT